MANCRRQTDSIVNLAEKMLSDETVINRLEQFCEGLCPEWNVLKYHEFGGFIQKILLGLSHFLRSHSTQQTPPAKSFLIEFYRNLLHDIVRFLHHERLDAEAIILVSRWLEELVIDLQDNEGSLQCGVAIRGFFTDLEIVLLGFWQQSEIHGYQKRLREANRFILQERRRYYTIFSQMIEPAFIVDTNMCIVDANRAFDAFFDLHDTTHHGKLCSEILGRAVCDTCDLETMIRSQMSFSGVEAVLTIHGEQKTVLFSGTFLGDINNEFSGGIISLQDITYNKETERALLASEEKYRTLVENMPDVTWRSDQDGNLLYISPNVENICGLSADTCIGQELKGFVGHLHPQDIDRLRNEYALFFTSQMRAVELSQSTEKQWADNDTSVSYDTQYRIRKNDGSWMWIHDRASKVYKKGGRWFADGVFSDVTELKIAEEELQKHQLHLAELVDERTAELRRANSRLESEIQTRIYAEKELLALTKRLQNSNRDLEQFAHIASHDIKEPLILILAFSERLLDSYVQKLDARGREYLVRLAKAAHQMKSLVDDLLELSRISAGELSVQSVDLTKLVDEVVGNLEEHIKKVNGCVRVSSLGVLPGDPIQLKQLFQNIIANALKYTKESVAPDIDIREGQGDETYLEVLIEDNGIGFDPAEEERIFEPFTRLHKGPEYDGTGIGLATCKKIVLRHGGEISAESSPGQGARFIIRLPLEGISMTKSKP